MFGWARFVWMERKIVRYPVFAGIVLALLGLSAWAGTGDYRLAGTVALGDGEFLALIEGPTGEQRIVHEGDAFEDGTVTLVTGSQVRIEMAEDSLILSLAGKEPGIEAETPPGPAIAGLYLSQRQLKWLQGLQAADEDRLRSAFFEGLALPQGLQLRHISVAQQEYSSLGAALPAIRKAFTRGEIPHLFFESGGGLDEVYLIATADSGEPREGIQ